MPMRSRSNYWLDGKYQELTACAFLTDFRYAQKNGHWERQCESRLMAEPGPTRTEIDRRSQRGMRKAETDPGARHCGRGTERWLAAVSSRPMLKGSWPPMSDQNYQAILEQIHRDIEPWRTAGRAADYIPELANVPANSFGMAVVTTAGDVYRVGQADTRFSIQSISKLFACTMAFRLLGDALWQRVGREPSGTAFNSLVQLEAEKGKPRNPFINAGALVVTDVLCRRFVKAETALVEFMRRLTGESTIDYDMRVAQSELQHAHRNRAMAHFMASFGNLEMPPEAVVDAYCRQCAISMNCVELAKAALFLANGGVAPISGEHILDASSAKRLSALMLTCGTYDAAGDFVYRVGLPAKSGVGGGIVAVLPGEMAVCVWSPGLDANGNSLAGVQALERLTTLTGRSIF